MKCREYAPTSLRLSVTPAGGFIWVSSGLTRKHKTWLEMNARVYYEHL